MTITRTMLEESLNRFAPDEAGHLDDELGELLESLGATDPSSVGDAITAVAQTAVFNAVRARNKAEQDRAIRWYQKMHEVLAVRRTKEKERERPAAEIACDETLPVEHRAEALNEWMILESDQAVLFVLSELENGSCNEEWLATLVFAAEDLRFDEEDQQNWLCRRLHEIAVEFRDRAESRFEQVVWSALRRFASLVPEEDAVELVEFVRYGNVDTRLVALQCIVNVFEAAPPRNPEIFGRLADRVFELATKLLDPDVLVPGETSAIAEQTIVALAALGDQRLAGCVSRLAGLKIEWFSQVVQQNLTALLDCWEGHETHPSYQQLTATIADSN